ncbi:hypothetical protein CN068_06885 [Sinorhizobium meliloti]|uniref:hypothetical protein n=1 Tax=Rhizobium meliloti TaxID=382 RepID=UPI000FDB4D96|nr:hypothetical protein [Sinorhizobium meliloti]RVH28178.1 hypothetical protein CN215_09965 [Sinorhizobium meliloti]RVQ41679.1 hypothetical protein CN068_06885 [Sinorhizobium meliloti]
MNDASNSTTGGARPPQFARRIGEAQDVLSTVQYLNEAVFLAAHGLMINETNAFQALSSEIEEKLNFVRGRLDEIREEMQ